MGRLKHEARSMDDVWAITCYFNPVGYRSRLANYRVFRRHLSVPLVTVELAYDAEFHLDRDDAEIMIQVRGGDVLWQKERLLNIALAALPRACRTVAGSTATCVPAQRVGIRSRPRAR